MRRRGFLLGAAAGLVGASHARALTTLQAATLGATIARFFAAIQGPSLASSGYSVSTNGWVAAVTFKNMPAQANGAVVGGNFVPVSGFDATKLTIYVHDSGFDSSGNPTTYYRTIKGTLPLRQPWPPAIAAGAIPAGSFGSNGGNLYFALTGGTQTGTFPTHTSGTQVVGGVSWTFVCIGTSATIPAGYFQTVSGSDVVQYAALDGPIYAATTIDKVMVDAGAYTVGGLSSVAGSAAPTNNSTLAYEVPIVGMLSPPHQRSTGSLTTEMLVKHAWGQNGSAVACVKAQAWNAARSQSSSVVTVSTPTLSTQVTTSSPGGQALEVYSPTVNTSGISYGDAFQEWTIYPWIGQPFSSRIIGEGADWQGNANYATANVVIRNGANLYVLATPGTSAASGGPTGTTTGITDGTCVWNYFGNDGTIQNSRNPQARHHFFSDPSNVYKKSYAFVDPAGTASGTAGVYSSYAAAYAAKGTLSNCYPTIFAALTAAQTVNNTAGGGTTHNDIGGCEIYLKAGTHSGFGGNLQTLNKGSEWQYIYFDPDASAGSVVWGANATNKQCSKRMWMQGGFKFTATATSTGNAAIDPASDGTTFVQPITELVMWGWTIAGFDTTVPVAYRIGLVWHFNHTVTTAFSSGSTSNRGHEAVIAGCSFVGTGSTMQISCCNFYGNFIVGTNNIRDAQNHSNQPAPMFWLGVDNYVKGLSTASGSIINVWTGGANLTLPYLGAAWDGNLVEALNLANDKCGEFGADSSVGTLNNVLITNNTHVGARTNYGYDDVATGATPLRSSWWIANNIIAGGANIISDQTAHTLGPNGACSNNWWPFYGVGNRRNGIIGGTTNFVDPGVPSSYAGMTIGLGSKFFSSLPANQFVADASGSGTGAGGGDYHPHTGAAALNMATVQSRTYDLAGALRKTDGTGAVGALERTF